MRKSIFLRFLAFFSFAVLAISCQNNKAKKAVETTTKEIVKTPVILVHSAWLGAWQWESVVANLDAKTLSISTPDLAGHGGDSTPANEITMDNYVNALVDLIDQHSEPVVLVGHSFNGITISRVAELRPKKIKKLIYLTAFLVPNGTSFFSAVQGVQGSKAVENFYLSEDKSVALVKESEMHTAFAHDIPLENFNAAKAHIVAEPAAPLSYALEVSEENFGSVPKYYIECTEDKAIPIDVQRAMYSGKVKKHYSLASSHTPNFSQPEALAKIITEIIAE